MSLRRAIGSVLDRSVEGRAFADRVRLRLRENPGGDLVTHPYLGMLEYMYVEASFLCNLECRMCPRLFEGHKEGLMPLERFARLAPLFPHLKAVVLTGYGEPMVHPQLHEFVRFLRAHGTSPRLSTNGSLLSEQKAAQLLDAGLDHLQMSLDAGTKATYEMIRVGAKWEKVLENAKRFHQLRDARGLSFDTGWVFVVMQDNWRELPLAVEMASRVGFGGVTAKFIERNALDYEQVNVMHDDSGKLLVDEAEFNDVIAKCHEVGERVGVNFALHPFHMSMNGACLADPMAAFFVDWMGNISPCCHLPVRNGSEHHPAHEMGNIEEQDVLEILLGPRMQGFWNYWREGIVPKVCQNCYQITRMPGGRDMPVAG